MIARVVIRACGAFAGRTTPVRATAAVALAFAAPALASCGEARDRSGVVHTSPVALGAHPATLAKAVATVEVSLTEYRLQPANVRVPRSGVIAFVATNDGDRTHALAVDGPAGEVATPHLRPGERRTIVVRLPPGTYKWLCPIADHEQRGMTGRVRVAE
jgi:uncharacterized cupredoxin-like copper-binding protein